MSAQHEVTEWDGRPLHALTADQMLSIYSTVPQWQGIAIGPRIPFGDGSCARVSVEAVFHPTREGAEGSLWFHVRNKCEQQRLDFNEEEWTITHLALVNGS